MPTWTNKVWSQVERINQSKAVNKTWEYANKVGEASNRLAGKMGIEAFYPTDLDRECEKAARILRTFTHDGPMMEQVSDYGDKSAKKKTQKVLMKIPVKAMEQAKGIAIFTVFRTGLGWSAASGSGIVVKRQMDGSWSPPCGILIHTLGIGFLAGIDIYDVVVILRHEKAIDAFTKPQVKFGAELAIAAGPVGNGFTLDAGMDAKPAWSYTKTKGLYGGAQLDGTIIVIRTDENARFYHIPDVKAASILEGLFPWPSSKGPQGLLNTLLLAEGKTSQVDMSLVPQGDSPSDTLNNSVVEEGHLDPEQLAEMEGKGDWDGIVHEAPPGMGSPTSVPFAETSPRLPTTPTKSSGTTTPGTTTPKRQLYMPDYRLSTGKNGPSLQ